MARIILVGGGSNSGKTHIIREMVKEFSTEKITHISIDDYYKCLDNLTFEERCKINYDHPKAFDWPLFRSQINDLKNDKSIEKPIYDFSIHNRKKETEHIEPTNIIIVEGIMALVDKEIRSIADLKVFINASSERRLIRRLARDQKERGRTYDSIVNQYLETVQPMYDEIVGPSSNYADIIINNDGLLNNSIHFLKLLIDDFIEK